MSKGRMTGTSNWNVAIRSCHMGFLKAHVTPPSIRRDDPTCQEESSCGGAASYLARHQSRGLKIRRARDGEGLMWIRFASCLLVPILQLVLSTTLSYV